MSRFTITHKDGKARIGKLKTQFGEIETPFFMCVATKAVGKHFDTNDLSRINQRAFISNALVLSMKPGSEVIEQNGGLHKFMNFNGCIFTDCGGFQASRSFFQGKTKTGLVFKNPYDGSRVKITPKTIMKKQMQIGSDVAMMLDDMAPYGASYEEAKKAVELTHKWGTQSLEIHKQLKKEMNSDQMIFGIVQGNFFPELRKQSAEYIGSLDFDGIAVGGVAIGEPKEEMYMAVESALPYLPEEKPKYIMGLGTPLDILNMIEKGVDIWDSIYPTQTARHNSLFTRDGILYIDRGVYKFDQASVDPECDCPMCTNHSRAYIHHLAKIKDQNGKRLMSLHNIRFIERMIIDAKQAIKEKRFSEFKKEFENRFNKK